MLTATFGFLRPAEIANGHTTKGNEFRAIERSARQLVLIDALRDVPDDELQRKLTDLQLRYVALAERHPVQIPPWAYARAQQGIEKGQSSYAGDPVYEEVDDGAHAL